MKTNRRFLLAAIFIATTFTFSCSSDDKDDGSPNGSSPSGGGDIGSCTGDPVTIGTQVWQKCNLNVVPSTGNSACYDNDPANCAKYGRLYDWAAAMTVCPSGWHLPSDAEWTTLTDYVGGLTTAGTKLKASSGWNSYSGVPAGTDDYGFAALPGGGGYPDGSFYYAGNRGIWWSATEDTEDRGEYDGNYANYRNMLYDGENVFRGNKKEIDLYSVRCLKN